MENNASHSSAPTFELGDIYYTLFRHKWKIIITAMLGIGLALAYYKLRPPPYMSEAKLFIRYVVTETKPAGPGRDEAAIKSLDQNGDAIIRSELQILTSLDLARDVAKSIGPEKLLGKTTDPEEALDDAALLIQRNLVVDANSSVIQIAFSHSNPFLVQRVLRELITDYRAKHLAVHRAAGLVNDALNQETDQLRRRLSDTEDELRKTINSAGVISLEDAKKTFGEQIGRIRQQIFDAQAELAERTTILQDMTRISAPATPDAPANAAEPTPVSPEQINAYQKTATRLALLMKREQEYLGFFTEESARVKEVRSQITEMEEQKKKMETDFPGLTRVQVATAATLNQPANANVFDPRAASAQIAALQAKVKILNAQMAEVRAQAAQLDAQETAILELRRRKELEESNYRYYATSLEQSRINEALGNGRVSNISEIETPTPALRDSKKTKKIMAGIGAAGIALGLAWAFAIELYFDRSIRRPADVERTLRLPLFLSIPRLKGIAAPDVSSVTDRPMLPGPAGKSGGPSLQLATTPTDAELALNPFYETLRDRLISYFDTLNVRHKPKLVAVTGLGKNTGVTTIAAGLARSFSETGEGNVLLVDMTQGQGSAQHFHKGANVVSLEQMLDTRGSAQVQDNLFVVSENSNSDRLAKGMPQRFNQLIPKLKASDFDYIIFDMPPVNQISVTPRLASFMDMMLMVIESEKTDREIALQASAMLAKSKAPVGVVLNKTKSYIPPSLHQDRDLLLGT